MKLRGCSHLEAVRRALALGLWPAACEPELRAHVAGCARCGLEVLLTQHLQLARAESIAAAPTGAPSLLWWRARARRRNAALDRAGLPVAAAFGFAVVVVLAAMLGLAATHWGSLPGLLSLASWRPEPALWSQVASLIAVTGGWGIALIVVGLGVLSTLAGLAIYLTTARQ